MQKLMILAALLALIGGAPALAQSTTNKGSSGAAVRPSPSNVPEAPVGHRQPRAGDVPDEKNLSDPNDPLTKENVALDRKLKSICRGC